jgi:hypothetical protein
VLEIVLKPIEKQKQETKALIDQNKQKIKEQNIEETALTDYQMQKKKSG